MWRSWLAGLMLSGVAHAATPRVAVLVSDDLDVYQAPVPAFTEALGQAVLVRNFEGRASVAEAVIEELKGKRIDVVLAVGAKAAYIARRDLSDVPMVYAMVVEPERYGVYGPQVTGIRATVPPVTLLAQYQNFFPERKRLGVLLSEAVTAPRQAELEAAAKDLGIALVVRRVDSPKALRRAFLDLRADVDGFYVGPDREVLSPEGWRALAEGCRERGLPLLVETENMVRAGGLFTVVPDPAALGKQAAEVVGRLLDGASPLIIAVQDPENSLVVMNVSTLSRSEIEVEELLLDFVDLKVE